MFLGIKYFSIGQRLLLYNIQNQANADRVVEFLFIMTKISRRKIHLLAECSQKRRVPIFWEVGDEQNLAGDGEVCKDPTMKWCWLASSPIFLEIKFWMRRPSSSSRFRNRSSVMCSRSERGKKRYNALTMHCLWWCKIFVTCKLGGKGLFYTRHAEAIVFSNKTIKQCPRSWEQAETKALLGAGISVASLCESSSSHETTNFCTFSLP